MLPLPASGEALYDGAGQNLGRIYAPLMVAGELTPEHTNCISTRPRARLMWHPPLCPDPQQRLGLVWMCPPVDNPLAASPDVLPFLVYTLEAAFSVKLYAQDDAALDLISNAVAPLLGGGHA